MSPKILNILLVLLPVVLYFGYLEPTYTGNPGLVFTPAQSIFVLKQQNHEYKNTLTQVEMITEELNKIQKSYNAIPVDVKDRLKLLLPDSIDEIKLRNEMYNMASRAGISADRLSVTKGAGFYSVGIDFKARYETFKKVMEVFERSARLLILDSASIKKDEANKDKPDASIVIDEDLLNVALKFKVHYLK